MRYSSSSNGGAYEIRVAVTADVRGVVGIGEAEQMAEKIDAGAAFGACGNAKLAAPVFLVKEL